MVVCGHITTFFLVNKLSAANVTDTAVCALVLYY